MCKIMLIGLKSQLYENAKSSVLEFLLENEIDLRIKEENRLVQIMKYELNSIPTLRFKDIELSIEPNNAFDRQLDEFKSKVYEYHIRDLELKAAGKSTCINCQCLANKNLNAKETELRLKS